MIKKLLFVVCCSLFSFIFLSPVVHADVTQFAFTTPVQTVAPNVLSAVLTVTSEDVTGTPTSIPNMMYVSLVSSSATGKFFSNTTGTVFASPVTMATNSKNKNFYYQDATTGTYTITANIALAKGGPVAFTTSQQITIGGNVATSSSATSTDDSSGNTSSDNSNSNNSSTQVSISDENSAHSSPAPLTPPIQALDFAISAGRNHFTSVDNNVLFSATLPDDMTGFDPNNIQYVWTFGDGSKSMSKDALHQYVFPGQYNVVLNASYLNYTAVSRTTVSVITPVISVTVVSGGIQISNNSAGEINLGDWTLQSGDIHFLIPTDTIVNQGGSVVFPQQVTKILANGVTLYDPLNSEIASTTSSTVFATTTPMISQATSASAINASSTVSQNAKVGNTISLQTIPTIQNKKTIVPVSLAVSHQSTSPLQSVSTTSEDNTATVYVGASQSSAFDSVFNAPVAGWRWIKSLFGK